MFHYNITLNVFLPQYQNGTKESKKCQAKYQQIIIMPSIFVYGRQVGISWDSVGIGRSQVGTDRYKSGLSLNKLGLGLHKSGLIVTSRH